jgi:energy-coupling factor transport system ATP-binding protein
LDYAIQVDNLWWRYAINERWSLGGVNLSVRRGEFLAIVGPSGAGKSTLCLCLTGLIPHLTRGTIKGRVLVQGQDTLTTPLSEITSKVGIVFQDPESQFITMSVEDEIAFPLENIGVPREDMVKRIGKIMDETRISGLKDKYPHELSGGQKQRVAIASFLALRPDILVLDEPTSDLDPLGKSEVFAVLAGLKASGKTLIVIEHNTEELCKYADRFILLYNGKIRREGAPGQFFSEVQTLREDGVYPPQVCEFVYALNSRTGRNLASPTTLEEASKLFPRSRTSITMRSERAGNYGQPADTIVSIRGLKFTYPDGTRALNGIDLDIGRGEYLAIIGQNASGKTTLVRHLVGLLKPTEGEVEVFGKSTLQTKITELATRMGYVYQNPDHQLFCKSVYEECAYGPQNLGLRETDIRRKVREVLTRVGLDAFEQTDTFLLGKGQRQRLAVAASLVMGPEVMIVDEPSTGQDMKQSEGIMRLLDSLNCEGKTILIVTHNMRLVAEHAKRVVVMVRGKILLDGDVRTVFSQPRVLRAAFITPPQITQLAQILNPEAPTVLTVDEMLSRFNMEE